MTIIFSQTLIQKQLVVFLKISLTYWFLDAEHYLYKRHGDYKAGKYNFSFSMKQS
jgi:hypothetical protein